MKLKTLIAYKFLQKFLKKFDKLFNSFYKNRLNYNLISLLKQGVEINHIYDIGAYKGEWSKFLSETSLKKKQFYLFEANKSNEIFLKETKFKYFIDVLSDEVKEVNFYSLNSTGDSYYKEQTEFYKSECKPKKITTNTLDGIINDNKLPSPNLIKIDTQGSELDILKGSKKVIKNCSLIYLECPVIEYNLNSPSIDQYIKFLNENGYVPYDICEIHKLDNVLIQIDILFLNKVIHNKIYPNKKILNIFN